MDHTIELLRGRARRHGLLVRSDVVPDLITRSAWRHAHSTGWLLPLHRGVSRLVEASPSIDQSLLGAIYAAGDDSIIGGASAAWVWGAPSAPPLPAEVVLTTRHRTPSVPGVVVHRPIDVADLRAVPRRGLPVCPPFRALLDVAAWHPEMTAAVLEELVVAGWLGIGAVSAGLRRHSRRGRPGIVALRAAVDDWQLGSRPPDSLLEVRMAELCARHGVPAFEFQQPIAGFRPDFSWPVEMAIAECDGWEHHGRTPHQLDRDSRRDGELQALGWVVWRFSWRRIQQHPASVARQLIEGLAIRRLQLGLAS